MKVNIAVQTLSPSFAADIDHPRDDLELQQFQDHEETSTFIQLIDRLYIQTKSKHMHKSM